MDVQRAQRVAVWFCIESIEPADDRFVNTWELPQDLQHGMGAHLTSNSVERKHRLADALQDFEASAPLRLCARPAHLVERLLSFSQSTFFLLSDV